MKPKTLQILRTIWKILKFIINLGGEHLDKAESKDNTPSQNAK